LLLTTTTGRPVSWHLGQAVGSIAAAAANIRRDGQASVLIDSPTEPYRGVHLVGEAKVRPATASPEEYADRFAAWIDDREAALQMIVMLRNIAPRVEITSARETLTWDLGISGAHDATGDGIGADR